MTSNYYCLERKLVGILEERSSSATPPYVLDLVPSGASSSSSSLAAVLSSGLVKVFDSHSLKQTYSLTDAHLRGSRSTAWLRGGNGASGLLIGCGAAMEDSDAMEDDDLGGRGGAGGIKFSTGDVLPSISLVDLRTSVNVIPTVSSATLLELSGGKKQLSSVATSADGTQFSVGIGTRIALFDLRKAVGSNNSSSSPATSGNSGLVASYEESHSEPVNQVAFHPTLRGHVLSAADDGLVCVFDSNRAGEDEALVAVLSVGSSVRRFGLFGESSAHALALTRTEGVSVWNLGSSARVADFSDLRSRLLSGGTNLDYLVDCKELSNETLVTLSGNDDGDLALIEVSPSGCAVQKMFQRNGKGHSATVRSAAWTPSADLLFTGGEDGVICAWRRGIDESSSSSSSSKKNYMNEEDDEEEVQGGKKKSSVMRRELVSEKKGYKGGR
jgi:WD40 repeat protein